MNENPYASSCLPCEGPLQCNPEWNGLFRVLAGLLMLVGTGWGALCALVIAMNPGPGLLICGPGYLVLAAYAWRAFLPCSGAVAKGLWALSLAVQGTWLVICLSAAMTDGPYALFNPLGIWWLTASLISLCGILADGSWGFLNTSQEMP